jgi:hypothetical protein
MRDRTLLLATAAVVAGVITMAYARHRYASVPAAAGGASVEPTSSTWSPRQGDRSSQMQEARLVLEEHCGLCHREDSPQAKRLALAVFNLNKGDWSASMSDDQLRNARGRLVDAPSGGDPAGAEDVARFDAFVKAELSRRREAAE